MRLATIICIQLLFSISIFGQNITSRKKNSNCEILSEFNKKVKQNPGLTIHFKELKTVDSLVENCSSKIVKCSIFKSLLTREFNNGNYKYISQLLKKYNNVLQPVKTKSDSAHLSSYFLFKGTNLITLNKRTEATIAIEQGINLANLTGNIDNAKNGYIMLSILFLQIRDNEKSIYYTRKAVELDKNNKSFEAYGDMLIATAYSHLENQDSSIYYFSNSEKKYRKLGENVSANYSKALLIKNIQQKYIGDFEKFSAMYSEKALLEFLEILEKDNMTFSLNEHYLVLANYYLAKKDYQKSEEYSKKSYSIAELIKNDGALAEASKMILKISISKYSPENSVYLTRYFNSTESLFNKDKAQATLALREKYNAQEMENQLLLERNKNLSLKLYTQFSIIGVLLILMVIYFVLRKLNKQKNERLIKLQKHAMQVQMNPHFIFNSLNSINNYISSNKTDNAQNYLTKFAKLMRITLRSSQEESILIVDEIYFLESYLSLEKLRNDNFDYTFDVSESLQNFKIPPLLIQPIIENSVIHGFKNLGHRGVLMIKISKLNEKLFVVISDNGSGIQRTNDKTNDHKSFATKIQQDRLKLYSKEYGKITYSEGIKDFPTPGTTVSFFLPILK